MTNVKGNKQKITPFLWYDNNAKEAAEFYVSVFENSRIIGHNPMVSTFELEGIQFHAMNGGPKYKLNESFSLSVMCDTQEEIDYYWNIFTKDGGEESMCGWLKDKFGLSWQIIPSILPGLMSDPDKRDRVVKAFLQMKKFDIEKLKQA